MNKTIMLDEEIQDDAQPVTARCRAMAVKFLKHVPASFPQPEIGVDPDGEVSFDWYNGEEDIFSVSISGKGRISWAAIHGKERVHGERYLPSVRGSE